MYFLSRVFLLHNQACLEESTHPPLALLWLQADQSRKRSSWEAEAPLAPGSIAQVRMGRMRRLGLNGLSMDKILFLSFRLCR